MSVNITLTGNLYDHTITQFTGDEVRYQAYFSKQNTGSSTSVWGSALNAILGQYNFNVADIIGTGGFANDGDVVIVVFWTPNTATRKAVCTSLSEWSVLKVELGAGPGMVSSDLYTNDVQLRQNICPNLLPTNWLPDIATVGQSVTATNTSNDTHQWDFDGVLISGTVTLWQRNTWYSGTDDLQIVNAINNTDYDWDDGNQDLDLPGAANGSHAWLTPGNYLVTRVIEDECGCTVTGTKPIQILNNAPTCGIKCNEATGQNITIPDTVVTFEYDGTDTNNTITSIDWKINDSGAYGTTNTTISGATASGVVSHTNGAGTDWCGHAATVGAFTNPGAHLIESWIHWYDGFNSHTLYCSETFNQLKFSGPTVDFDQVPPQATVSSGVKFTNTSTSTSRVGLGLPDCDEYDWTWDDDGNVDYELDKPYSFELERTPTTASCKVKLCADWSDGWDTLTTCEEKDVVFETTVTVTPIECYYNLNIVGTSSDGSVTGYEWEIYQYTTFSGGDTCDGGFTGTTELLWSSPVGMDQQDKKVCFTALGCYKLVGYVHGTGATTSDYENLHIDEVCEPTASGIEIVPICPPDVDAHERGRKDMKAKELLEQPPLPRIKIYKPNMKGDYSELKPDMHGKEMKPGMRGIPDTQPSARIIKTFPFYVENL